ncbi:ABC transporter substrate-binding protein [Stomatohabitans albus]|uniref:ABC transporter substrate-binding protein n=1 Tax=Stomatohabitans albus TaxID=3110766 RepID=UPI00300D2744
MIPRSFAALVLAASTLLAACSSTPSNAPSDAPSDSASATTETATSESSSPDASEPSTETAGSSSGAYTVAAHTTYPYETESCGRKLTFKESPKKVVSIGFATVPTMIDLGLEDRIAGLTQEIPEHTYPAEMEAKMKAMPRLLSSQKGGGGVEVSTETILNAEADMTIGPENNMDFDALAAAGVQGFVQAGYCRNVDPAPAKISDIHDVYDAIGQIFDVPEAAAKAKEDVDKRLEAVKGTDSTPAGTAAVLYLTPGEATVWTYGTSSMAHVIMETAGLDNVYKDNDKRVFELSLEDLLARNPDRIILVNIGYDEAETKEAFTTMGNMKDLKAVKEDKVMVMPFAWTDPASSLVVDGIEKVSTWVNETK